MPTARSGKMLKTVNLARGSLTRAISPKKCKYHNDEMASIIADKDENVLEWESKSSL